MYSANYPQNINTHNQITYKIEVRNTIATFSKKCRTANTYLNNLARDYIFLFPERKYSM